ncbi:MAG: hypothetical protein LKE77_08350 [Companilactobacillus sp.]|jgi:hypothetical protein|uniref:hypothetical protein n=1 Tax=Companilactobacillus sp. TaxID=2767905 RepID=UPI0025C3006D|nr:hypothetical protein [Companilactobacillus sp.]MCH4010359.1 hypothetical protein [Companilactobacillus sp.]MCH4051965.1 hypothetical protein [Companilactobacillus sp.]MCH4075799.1 hypothetical protein [Companilactobacillus sp.]MCH4126877.1 hypothetical protein [Companilactobacillus sp.]
MRYQIIKQIQTEETNESYPVAQCTDFTLARLIADTLTDNEPSKSYKRVTFMVQPWRN